MINKLIVIGVSAGGVDALRIILDSIDGNTASSMVIVTHIKESADKLMALYVNKTSMIIKEAEDGEKIKALGYIYFAPPRYHLSIEADKSFSLSQEEKVNFVRPSIDILFMSAAEVYKEKLMAIILTGANNDGAMGLKTVEAFGGQCIVQDPDEALFDKMPSSALEIVKNAKRMSLAGINKLLK